MTTRDELNTELADHLMVCLANATVLYHRSHGFHWNVVGPDFPEWHDKFAEIYEDIYGSLDPIAENLRKLGFVAPFCLWDLSEHATINDDFVESFDSSALVENFRLANNAMIVCLNQSFSLAIAANQQGIANFIAERIDMHQKWNWQLTVSL